MFWIEKNRPAVVLAPMEGVTDFPMRTLMTERGGFQLCVSEFLRVNQDPIPDRVILRHVPELLQGGRTQSGVVVIVQILGGDPERMAETAQRLVQLGALGIDINFGCPAPTVNRHDGGAVLLKSPERVKKIVASVRQALPSRIPVSAKLRLGWESIEEIHTNAAAAVEGGASWLTIHARTRLQGYSPPVYWGKVGQVRKEVPLPVIANGDIWDLPGFLSCLEQTGCEHFMIGRGALGNPNLVFQMAKVLGLGNFSEARPFEKSAERWRPLFERFSELCAPHALRPCYTLKRIKQWANIAGKREDTEWIESVKRARQLEDVWTILGRPGSSTDRTQNWSSL